MNSDGKPRDRTRIHPEDPPPVLGSWRRIYALVLGALALWILLFVMFGRAFR